MEFIFKNYFVFGNEIVFYFLCGIILSIMIACFILGYLEVKK